jgi:hypothetical protein
MEQDKIAYLAESIKKAREVMIEVENRKSGSPTAPISNKPNVDTRQLVESVPHPMYTPTPQVYMLQKPSMKNLSTSKMPEAILKSFQEQPMIDPTAPLGGTDQLMNELASRSAVIPQPQPQPQLPVREQQVPLLDTKLIEFIIKKTVEETLEQVAKKTSVDENFQIKIGDKTFGGKLTTLNEIKKK